jgi:ABC-type cobalamin/Fe3+-siderophores transport system ATPase subunit
VVRVIGALVETSRGAVQRLSTVGMLDAGRVVGTGSPEQVLTAEAVRAVYGMHVERVYGGGCLQLIFSPIDEPGSHPSR